MELVKVKLQVILKMAHQKVGEMFGGAYFINVWQSVFSEFLLVDFRGFAEHDILQLQFSFP